MRDFFRIIFGGLFAIIAGIIISVALKSFINDFPQYLTKVSSFISSKVENGSKSINSIVDNTSISGLKRLIRYSASEEEGLITSATLSLPNGQSGKISAKAYVVWNITENNQVLEYNSDQRLPVASLTKIVTATMARNLIRENKRINITKEIMSVYGNTAQFKVGETFYAGDLLYPLLMVSSNDAGEALSRSYGRKGFIKAMNDFAQDVGAYRTTFVDPTGLSPENKSTANDLVAILEWVYKNDPETIAITRLKSKNVRAHTWVNPAHFLSWSNYRGGKNGFTDEAGQTGLALFQMGADKDIYAVAILGSKERDADMVKLLGKVK